MSEAFQTFLLIATFDIALIAITIGNYAVSASFLGRETRLSRWRMEKKKQNFSTKLLELKRESVEIEGIKKEIEDVEKEKKKLRTRLFLLSWLGAVISPSIFFIVSFINAVLGMNSDVLTINLQTQRFYEQQFIIFSFGSLAIGFMVLLFVIRTIDSAARKIPLPEIEVFFEKHSTSIKVKANSDTFIDMCLKNKGEDIAEDVDTFVHFPPEFTIREAINYTVHKQVAGMGTDYPNYNSVKFHDTLMHLDIFYVSRIFLILPNEKKNYEIPVYVHERKIGLTKHILQIELID